MTREVDCPFGDGHIEADDDETLLERVRAHAADKHPELTDERVRQVVTEGARDSQ